MSPSAWLPFDGLGFYAAATADWLALYAAVVSTILAVRELGKARARVGAFFAGDIHSDDVALEIGRTLTLQNLGGVPTAIDQIVPAVPKAWVPRRAIPWLTRWRVVPVHTFPNGVVGRWWTGSPIAIGAYQEIPKRITLWPEHLAALNEGRLLLLVRHSYSHGLTQQVQVGLVRR